MAFGYTPAAGLRRLVLLAGLLATLTTAEEQENGLSIETTKEGDCSLAAKNGDVVSMHYTGTLAGGSVFDTSYKRHAPFEFKLGEGMVIEGWDIGLVGMCLGEERTLVIPPDMAYGARKVGHIPPQSTLTFETKLMGVNGVTEAPESTSEETASESEKENSTKEHTSESQDGPESEEASDKPATSEHSQSGAENGECRLLGPFALIVQAGLGVLALSSLVWKRYRERPRRPIKVWFFDASKQVVGAALLHLLNVLMSMVSSEDYQLASSAKQVQDDAGRQPNPCSFYLINIAVDTTIGIPILILFLKVLHFIVARTPLARPAESIRSGNYGSPPRASWWVKQSFIYFVGLVMMKFCVLLILTVAPGIALVGDWALRWTEGSEALQIVFVMFVFPLIMNAIQYYIIDSFIKDPASGGSSDASARDDDEDGESREPLHRASEYEEGGLSPRESEDQANIKGSATASTMDARDSTASERQPLTGSNESKQ